MLIGKRNRRQAELQSWRSFLQQVARNIWTLGTLGDPKIISIYLVTGRQNVLIEAGPSSVADAVIEQLSSAGFTPEDITAIAVTHVHLDHAGGAWALLERMPNAKVLVYEPGAKHLIDPSKLRAASAQILGEMVKVWGEIQPVPADRVKIIRDGDRLPLDGAELRFIATTGHAPHHMSIYEPTTNTLFTGDAVGLYYLEMGALWPASPPPSFDLERALSNLDALAKLKPRRLMLPHFGVEENSLELLARNRDIYLKWDALIGAKASSDPDPEEIISALVEEFPQYRRILENPYARRSFWVDVVGYLDYHRRIKAPFQR